MLNFIREAGVTPTFRRERRWFALGLAALSFAIVAGMGICRDDPPNPYSETIPYSGVSNFGIWLRMAACGALGMWLAGDIAYSMTHKQRPHATPPRLRDVLTHTLVVPFIAFPIAGLAFGVLAYGFERAAAGSGLIVASMFGSLLFSIPCLLATCAWSMFYLYVLRPRLVASSAGRSATAPEGS